MTTYVFDQIDPAHPPLLILVDNSDKVLFHGGPARTAVVTYGLVEGQSVTTISFGGHTVPFELGVRIVAANHNLIFDDGSNLLIGGPRNEAFEGGPGDDALFGGDGDDTLEGHNGENFLQGNQGNDQLKAGAGADTVLGGKGDDDIQTATGFVSVAPPAGDFANGNLGNDTISGGFGADTLLGGQGDDIVFGESGVDFLNGNLGDDRVIGDGAATILGEAGNDTLTARGEGATLSGGDGADLFVFFASSAADVTGVRGVITDWAAEDTLRFSHVGAAHAYAEITAPDFASALAAANQTIRDSQDPSRAGGEVVMVQVGGDVFAFAANIGSTDSDLVIRLVGRSLADVGPGDIL